MKHNSVSRMVLAAVLVAALPAFAAISSAARTTVKTVTWTLPADWETSAEFGYPTEPVGAPSLPFIPVSIKVPTGSVYSNCTVEATWEAVKDAKRPDVIQEPFIVGEKPVVTPEDPQYFGLARYPAKPEAIGGIENCAGEASIRAWVTPYRWNGQAGILEKATSIKLTFTYTTKVQSLKFNVQSSETLNSNYTGVMYIISPPNFVSLWQAYVDYRKTTHPNVEFHIVNTQTEIYDIAAYDGHDDALRIHKYLEARYAERGDRKMYAILGAGCAKGNESYDRATMIPLRMTAAANTYYYPGDLYYSCMDKVDNKGEVWDYDSDQVYLGYKKSGGGYASDAAWKVDWLPDIAAFRFPVRTSAYLQNVSSSASKTYTAEQQIKGLVNKLKIYEGAADKSRSFGGNFTYSVSYHKLFEDMYRGSTDDKIAGERSFFDGIANMWSANHNATIEDSEMITRYLNYAYVTTGRPVAGAVNNTQVPNNDVEITTHSSHGQEQTAAPFQAYDFFANSRIHFFMNTGTSCLTGKIDTGDVDGHGNLCFAEACILNPNGGAIVTLNNIREGWGAYPGYHETLSLVMQAGLINGFYRLGDGTAYEAFIKGHKYATDRVGNPSGTMAGCYVESNMMGDPLAKLSPINDTGTFVSPVGGWFLKNATATNSVNFTGTSGSVNLTVTPATANEVVTLSGSQYKVTGGVTVNNGATLKWNAPGGFGRNGIAFSGARGKIVCEGTNSRYFGTRFSGIDEILVTGYNTTFDFDKTGVTRDVKALKYIGTGAIGSCNYIRSREGGIFSPSMSIPVENGTLVLQTTNIGGGGNASDTTTPIFTLTNAVLKIAENPHWANEMLNRPVWMNGATITVAYQSFGFGAKVSGSKGMTLRVLDKESNTISGSYDAEINGPFGVEVLTNAVLKIHVPLTKSSYAGSLVKTGEGQLELRAANTFTGGIAVNAGTMVFGKEALTSSACGEVTVASNATLKIEALPLASVTKLTVKAGGKLILPGDVTTASYQLVDPMVGSLNFEEGALVYNVNDLTKTLKGSTTSDGYYMDTSSFLHWQDKDGTWVSGTAADGTKWLKGGEATNAVDFANGNSVMFNNSTNAGTRHVAVSGSLQPGYITLNNTKTAYSFTNATSGAKISLENLYTIGDTTFEPEVSAGSKVVVTSGKATYNNLTTASLSVAPEGKLQLKGTLTPATYISAVKVDVTAYRGEYNFILGGNRYRGFQFNGIQFCLDGKVLAIPAGTTISVSGSFNGSSSSGTATVQGVNESGVIAGYTGAQAVANILDGNASTGWGGSDPGENSLVQAKPTCSVTINFGSPIRMFTSYKLAGGNSVARSPYSWKITVTESSSGKTTQVHNTTVSTSANNWWTSGAISYSGASSASVDVSEGGMLFLNGTYNAPITVGEDARLAVTNTAMLTANKGFTMNGNVALDVSEAGKYGWTEVLHGANLATTSLSKFVLSSEDAAAKIESGNLYVATEGVKKGPYAKEFAGDTWDWNTTGWTGNGIDFGCTWSEAITRMADNAFVTLGNSSTGTLGCAVSCNTIFFTNTTDNTQTVRINGSGSVNCTTLDFSGLKGEITWSPDLNGANVIAGTNRVILLSGVGNTVSVASNGYVSTVGTFTTYDIQPETYMHFAGSPRSLNMSQLPSQGILSFENMTVASGTAGAFQKPNITYLVEDGQSLIFADSTGYNARMTSSFDVRGGTVTVNPNGAWWFGQNGITMYDQTGGTFTCNATGSVLFGYQGESSFLFDISVAGGTFEIPNAAAQIYNPANINIHSNGVFKAKGVTVRDSVTGTININELGTLEIGSTSLATSRVTYNLYGGVLSCFENATVSATLELGVSGTLAAKSGTTLTVDGTINADSATLNFGKEGYTGTVKLETIPAGVTNITVTAGTWDMGIGGRGATCPTNCVLSRLNGFIAARLTDDELRMAAQGGLTIFKTTLSTEQVANKLKVVTSSGTEVPATGKVDEQGNLVLAVSYVYPLVGEVKARGEGEQWNFTFSDIDWTDSIGMPFHGEWSEVRSAVLSNALEDVTVVVTNAFTTELKVVNVGQVKVRGEGEQSIATVDDSGSTGVTTLEIAANNVTAGSCTKILKTGTTLNVASGKYACLADGVTFTTQNVVAGAHVRYDSTATRSALGGTMTGAIYSYNNALFNTNIGSFNWVLRTEDGDAVALSDQTYYMPIDVVGGTLTYGENDGECYYGGNASTGTNSVITVNGGTMKVNVTGTVNGASPNRGFIIGVTRNNVTKYPALIVNSGVFDCSSGLLAPWENCSVTVNGGTLKAKGIYKGGINAGSLNLKGGTLEIGSQGIGLRSDATANTFPFNLAGGTLRAVEDVALSYASTLSGTVRLQAATGKTLTIGTMPTGTGTLICGDATNDGTVLLTGGDYSNLTLGGTFTIRLTDAQKTAKVNTTLFKTADGFDATKVTIQNSDGTAATGAYHLADGKYQWVPEGAYVMPIRGEIGENEWDWSEIAWRDSSETPKTVDASYWANGGSVATVELTVTDDATLTCADAITVASLNVTGDGRLSMPSANLTLNKLTGDGTVVCDGFCRKYTGLSTAMWTGTLVLSGNAACTGDDGYDFTDLGNANSTVEVTGLTGWFNGCSSCAATPFKGTEHHYTLRIGAGGLTLNNGCSNQAYCFDAIDGTGNIMLDIADSGPTMRVVAIDATNYEGTITVKGNAGFVIGTPGEAPETGICRIDGQYNATYGKIRLAAPNGVKVRAGGFVNLVQTDASQTAWPICSGTLTMNGGVKVNGVAVGKDRYTVSGGTITLNGNAVGASVSINVGGGAASKAGKLISSGNYAGVVPVQGKNWNQDALQTATTKHDVTISNLKEVLSDGSVITGPMKAHLLAKNTYSAVDSSTSPNGDGELMFGYLDDGSGSGTGKGAGVYVENIPYTTYDVYVYMGTDQTSTSGSFGVVTLTAGGKTSTYPSSGTSWGNATTTHNAVTLKEGDNYCKFTGCSGSSLTILGAVGAQPIRCGIAGIQIFNTGVRVNEMTWNGGASGGTWDKATANWKVKDEGEGEQWKEISDGLNVAKFSGDTALTLGETVCPDVIDITTLRTMTREGFVPASTAMLFKDVKLSDVTAINGEMSGGYVTAKGPATPYFFSNNGSTATVQLQIRDGTDTIYLKSCQITLTQSGNDVAGYVSFTRYLKDGALGTDIASKGYSQTTATTDDGDGYGIRNLSITYSDGGVLTVASAEKFGKAFVVTNGMLTVAAGALEQDVTLAAGTFLNVLSTEIATEYVMTKGKVKVEGQGQETRDHILFNGEAIDGESWSVSGGTLKRIVKPGTTPFSFTITQNGETQWTNAPWVASNWFYVRPEEWTTNTVAEADLTVETGVTNTLVANADMTITKLKVVNSGWAAITNGQVKGEKGEFVLSVTTVDDGGSSGTTWLGFPVSAAAITAGADTVLTTTGTGNVTIGSGMMATLYGDAALERAASTIVFSEGTGSYRSGALKFGAANAASASLPSGYADLFKTTGHYIVDRALAVDGELVFGNANNNRQYSTFEVGPNAHLTVTKLHTCNGQNYFQGTQNGGVVEVTSTDEGDAERANAVLFGHWNGQSAYNLNCGQMLVAGGIMLGWDSTDGDGTSFNIGAANEAEPAYVRAASIRGCTSGNADKKAKLTVYPNGILETKNGILMTHANSAQKQFALAGGTVRTTGANATIGLVHASGVQVTAPSTIAATNGTTLTVASKITGTGGLTFGEADWAGTVILADATELTGNITVEYGTLEMPTNTIAANIVIGANGTLNLVGLPGSSAPTEFAITTGTIAFGEGASITNNITVNGVALKADEKWEVEGGKIKRRIITPPFTLYITQNGNWDDQKWYDAKGVELRDYEIAECKAQKPAVTLNVQNESLLFITNLIELASLDVTGANVTFDFSQNDGEKLAAEAKFLKPCTNAFIKATAITGNYSKTAPNLPAGYTGEFLTDVDGISYVITAPRKGYDYVGTIYHPYDYYASFDDIEWENGVAYTNDYQNTVTIRVAGDIDLYVTKPLDLYKLTFVQYDSDDPAYVYLCTTGDFAETFANVRSFDFGGATIVDSMVDFGARIEKLPLQSFQLESAYSGSLKEKYAFCADGNVLVGSDFGGTYARLFGGGTLTGDFRITNGGAVMVYGAYTGAGSIFDVGSGTLQVYTNLTLKAVTNSVMAGNLVIDYDGSLTADLSGFGGTVTVGAGYDETFDALHMMGTAKGTVIVNRCASLYLTRTVPKQTAFVVTTGTLDFADGAKLYVDGELIPSERIASIKNGTITLKAEKRGTVFVLE